ncbi:beta-ketoacyl-[acyl-carrier-protein] synthase family protein [Chloroflexota bacterium]
MLTRRVVITGMGLITALGIGNELNWFSLINGDSGISYITSFNASSFPTQMAAEVKNFKAEEYIKDKKIMNRLCKGEDYGLSASKMAIDDAGLGYINTDHNKGGGIYIGCGKEFGSAEQLFPAIAASMNNDNHIDRRRFGVEAIKQTNPLCLIQDLPNAILFYISKLFKLQGINSNVVVGGTASSQAIGDAYRAIQYGDSNFIIAGGFDSAVNPIEMSFLCSLGLLSTRNSEPKKACTPFDITRDGFVLGEGAGMVILEELSHALARKAKIYAELVGYAATSDLTEVMRQEHIGQSLADAITEALDNAQITPWQIDYINANGDGTPFGDRSETLSIKMALKKAAGKIPISSIKPIIGHLMAASGAVDLIFTLLAMEKGKVPPTINYRYPDPSCDLDYVPNRAREIEINAALSINRCGVSGRNTALIIKKFDGVKNNTHRLSTLRTVDK